MQKMKAETPNFIPGLELAEAFFQEAVGPILESHLPDLEYSAALIGSGSEVLGFDTEMSTDHHWGPRAMLFVRQQDYENHRHEIGSIMGENLPFFCRSYSTNWSQPDPEDKGVQHLSQTNTRPINHRIEVFTIEGFFEDYLGIDINSSLSAADWLTLPQQRLRSVVGGQVFHDDLDLQNTRHHLSWYPHDVWLYILASCWSRIGEDEHLMGRAGQAGDELGSAIIASRLVRDIMRLAFLMELVYPPYAKWYGTAFDQLPSASALKPHLEKVLNSTNWKERDAGLALAYEKLAKLHNTLGITKTLPTKPETFFGRPFTVIHGERFAAAIKYGIQDPSVKKIAKKRLIGNIDLVSDNTDLLEDPKRRQALLALYG